MNVGDLIERALYLSIKDRYFNALPSDQAARAAILQEFLPTLNDVLVGISKKNGAYTSLSVPSSSVQFDPKLSISYINLEKKFMTIFRAEFLYSGSTFAYTLTRVGLNDFFSNAMLRTFYTFPYFYNYNVFTSKLYLYPTPSVTGTFNIYGKERIGPFTSITEEFPDFLSETFLLYVQYFFAKFISSEFNAPWQAQKDELLSDYKKSVASENNIAYQEISTQQGSSVIPVRNVRTGL